MSIYNRYNGAWVHLVNLFLMFWLSQVTAALLPYFEYPSPESFDKKATDLNGPFANVASASKILGISDAVHNQKLKCSPSILSISHRESLAGDYLRPQVYISGEIHGNEKVVIFKDIIMIIRMLN
jgi:hypothetical protein